VSLLHRAPLEEGKGEGRTDPEIAESVLVAAALRAGGAITHGTHAMVGG